MNATNQSVAAIDFPSQARIDGNSIALVCYPAMRVIEDHKIDELILTQVLGWKWMSFLGLPTNDHPNYRNPDVREKGMRVRELFSPKQLKSKDWEKFFEEHEGREADGTEPLSYGYCSSMGPARPPRLFILVDE